jgi:hypothetical protein
MELNRRVGAFSRLGDVMRQASAGEVTKLTAGLLAIVDRHHLTNEWFTPATVRMALSAFGDELTHANLNKWVSAYPELKTGFQPKRVAVVMAGNIPMVGFHDMLSVLISGHTLMAKYSSKDDLIIRELAKILVRIEPMFEERISFSDSIISGFDAVIATGSNNTSRYFEYYFGKWPNLIRRNRTGMAIISGNESRSQLKELGNDIFSYFGLGCRNVTKLYLPYNYDLTTMIREWSDYADILNNRKYLNNYNFNRSVLTLNRETFTDSGFALLRESGSLFSPVSVVNYEFADMNTISYVTEVISESIQVIVSSENHTPFGHAQRPKLWDYSDGSDTIDFLLKIK